jgi:hypothetical protein
LVGKLKGKTEKVIKECVWSVAVCGSAAWTVGENDQRVVNGFGTWCWRRMLQIKWRDRITNGELFLMV